MTTTQDETSDDTVSEYFLSPEGISLWKGALQDAEAATMGASAQVSLLISETKDTVAEQSGWNNAQKLWNPLDFIFNHILFITVSLDNIAKSPLNKEDLHPVTEEEFVEIYNHIVSILLETDTELLPDGTYRSNLVTLLTSFREELLAYELTEQQRQSISDWDQNFVKQINKIHTLALFLIE